MELEDDIKENLGRLPETLEGAYSQIYNAILSETPRAQRITMRAFMWVMCSRKLLTQEEWAEACYWPGQAGSVHTLLKLCRNLVTWDNQSKVVGFAHLSVREYLESKFTPIDANSMAAKDCLLIFDPTHWPAVESQCFSLLRNSFVKSSTIYWPDHVESSYDGKNPMGRGILELLQRFLGTTTEPGQAYCNWLQKAAPGQRYKLAAVHDHLRSTPPNPLFAASYFRFGRELQEHWERNSFDINCRNDSGETLLLVASMQGNERVVNFLLEKEANVNAGEGKGGSSPLMEAVRKGQGRIVVQFLEKGAGRDTNVLELAAYEGNGTVMEVLLDRDPNIKIAGEIVVASVGNKLSGKEVVKVLLDRDPDIKITESTLMVAVANCEKCFSNVGALKLLVDRSPNIKITDAVVVAAINSRWSGKEVMKVLLDKGPDIKIAESTLMVAVASCEEHCSNVRTLKILVDRSLNIKVTDAVLVAAAGNEWSGKEVMKALLDRNPDVKITDAVVVAAAGNEESGYWVMEMLLDRNPNIKITDAVVVAATGNKRSDKEVIGMLKRNLISRSRSGL